LYYYYADSYQRLLCPHLPPRATPMDRAGHGQRKAIPQGQVLRLVFVA
jgi:hypothetical protein